MGEITNFDFITKIFVLIIAICLVLCAFCVICIIFLSISIFFGTRHLKKRAVLWKDAYDYYLKNNQIISEMKTDETLENNSRITKELIYNCNRIKSIFNEMDQLDIKY